MKLKALLIALFLLAATPLFAAAGSPVSLYVFSRPFSGKVFAIKSSVLVEAGPLLDNLKAKVEKSGGKTWMVRWNGRDVSLSIMTKGKGSYVTLKDAAKALGLSYDYNSETGIADLFKPAAVQPDSEPAARPQASQSGGSPFNVRITASHMEQGIDQAAVLATLENDGSSVSPGMVVVCSFTDQADPNENEHVFERQQQKVNPLQPGQSANLVFTVNYPSKSTMGSYRDYDKNINYHLQLYYVLQR